MFFIIIFFYYYYFFYNLCPLKNLTFGVKENVNNGQPESVLITYINLKEFDIWPTHQIFVCMDYNRVAIQFLVILGIGMLMCHHFHNTLV